MLDRASLLRRAHKNTDSKLGDRLYCAGWFHRGPHGTIADSRTEAQATAERILSEFSPDHERVGSGLFSGLKQILDYSAWQRIDTAEVARRSPDRCRQKSASTPELLNATKL